MLTSNKIVRYVLVDKVPVPFDGSMEEWAGQIENLKSRQVASTNVSDKVRVSTVFLGIDHNFYNSGKPVLFETMIFGGPFNDEEYQERCSTWEEAEVQHEVAVDVAREALKLES